ncbi:MAG: hypothetical protein RLN70_02930, partial [Rhodospirillaceae bacterium]
RGLWMTTLWALHVLQWIPEPGAAISFLNERYGGTIALTHIKPGARPEKRRYIRRRPVAVSFDQHARIEPAAGTGYF